MVRAVQLCPALQNLIGRAVAIGPEADVGDDFFTGVFTPFDRGTAKVGEGDDARQCDQTRINLRFAREHVEPGPCKVSTRQRGNQGFLVN